MMQRKRKREPLNVDAELVDIYEGLASEEESRRLKAASLLLAKTSPANGADGAVQQKALQRLIKGLSSGRKGARVGFSVVLAEFLRLYGGQSGDTSGATFTISEALNELEKNTHVSADAARQEIRDHYLGKVFGAAAFIQSGVLFPSDQDTTNWKRVLSFVVTIVQEKSWLREECGWMLYQTLTQLTKVSYPLVYAAVLVSQLAESALFKTPEGIALWIGLQAAFPEIELPKGVFEHGDPLHKKQKATLARILKESSSTRVEDGTEEQSTQSSGYWNPKIHFSWRIVFDELARRSDDGDSVKFADLWKEAVDDGLFSMKASHQRRYWGFHLFQHFVLNGSTEDLASVIGPNLLRCLANQAATDDRLLNVAATQSIQAMVDRAKSDSESVHPMVMAILTHNVNFDRATKSKVTEKLLTEADLHHAEQLCKSIVKLLKRKLNEGATNQQDILSLADCVVCLVRTQEYPKESAERRTFQKIVDKVLDLLVTGAFAKKSASQPLVEGLKARIMSCLNHVITKDVDDLAHHPYHVLSAIESTGFKLDAEEAVVLAVSQARQTLSGIISSPAGPDQKDILQAFKLLFTFGLLQTYYGEADAINVLDDLDECYRTLRKKNKTGSVDESVTALVEVIVEFVSRQSALYRRLAPKILAGVADRITEKGLDVMLDVLDSKEDTQGQGELFSTAGEDDMDLDEAEQEDSDEASESAESDASSSSGDSGSSVGTDLTDVEESEEEKEEDDDEELAAFDAKLAEALGTRRGDEDIAINDAESSDEDMDDAEMEGLDAHLSNIFKQRMGKRTKGKDKKRARDTIINFKTKVLELLEIYVKREYRSPRSLHIVGPLLLAMEATTSNLISQKCAETIKQFSKLYKVKTDSTKDDDVVAKAEELLGNVHTMISRSRSQLQAKACSSASLLAVKAILSYGGSIDVANEAYEQTLKDLKTDGLSKFRQCFVEDWRNWRAQASRSGIIESA